MGTSSGDRESSYEVQAKGVVQAAGNGLAAEGRRNAGLPLIQTDTNCTSSQKHQHHSVIEWMTLQADETNATSDGFRL